MRPTPHAARETMTETDTPTEAATEVEIEVDTDERLDENLHFGRSWHRYRYFYRKGEPLRVLDAGCGTGGSSLTAAKLNPGASVLGLDASAAAVGVARRRTGALGIGGGRLDFLVHDLAAPLPETLGRFDFVICRQVLGHAADPDRLLLTVAGALAPGGLLLATFPSRHGRQGARALRGAVDALAAPEAGMEDRVRIGLEVVQALRIDHPVRSQVAQSHARDSRSSADSEPDLTRAVVEALAEPREWSLAEATLALETAGLTFLYAATPWRWQPDRVFDPDSLPAALRDHVERLDPGRLTRLIDALDPQALDDDYALYACPTAAILEPPAWPRTRRDDPASFDRLTPHLTGLARPDQSLPAGAASQGRTLFRTVSGALGELDRISVLRLAAVDGRLSCAEIDGRLASHTRASDNLSSRQNCWINLADSGLIILEPAPEA